MAYYGPKWWHHHGSKMHAAEFHPEQKLFTIENNAAKLLISSTHLESGAKYWKIVWTVRQSLSEGVNGTTLFTDEDLAIAFGLKPPQTASHSRHLTMRYGGDRAFQGKYIGVSDYLNIPMPGTGHDGDPNISIEIDDKMREAIRELLAQK